MGKRAWIELGLEDGLGGARDSRLMDLPLERRGRSIGPIAAGIAISIISAVKRLRTKLKNTFSLVSTQLK